jgi:hypothetical protein
MGEGNDTPAGTQPRVAEQKSPVIGINAKIPWQDYRMADTTTIMLLVSDSLRRRNRRRYRQRAGESATNETYCCEVVQAGAG